MTNDRASLTRKWTLLTNHGAVLIHIARNPRDTVVAIAGALALRERTIAGILSDLRKAGYVRVERLGRNNSYVINFDVPLRRPEQEGVTLRQFFANIANLPDEAQCASSSQ